MFCRRVVVLKKKENVEHDVLYEVDVSKLDALKIDHAKLRTRNFNNLLSVSCTLLPSNPLRSADTLWLQFQDEWYKNYCGSPSSPWETQETRKPSSTTLGRKRIRR